MTIKVLMFAGDFVEDYEVMVPFQALESLGVTVDVVCPGKKKGECIATAIHDFTGCQTYVELRGHNFTITKDFDTVNVEEYRGLYITGGRAPEYIRLNQKIIEWTRHFFDKNLPVAAICHGIQVLVAANVVKSRTLTCYPAVSPDVTVGGGAYKEVPPNEAVLDGNLVTSPAWPGHQAILREFYKMLGIKITI
ncbi:putative PFPI/DJ-1-like protein putativecysteine peptidase Clan PC(C) family C56 [Leptomonas pyrrhocoris]|uniref:Putative PFPI/DJ-1-like protein putativecysteine peptidase Clan PC(C) family C56 n=1 Tax=Leptomonas pyrrhocoris TaxID=157538 RepID=A0A0N0VHZ1_LEPPY|nr:putative PFPI/DJ-1-like protein putativecysteine peptidase Clan PC(C) family C56 [Leptomonas pyrrhocoris]KPA86474.1 putative PFPI/DJ-1-like protein putativecysteine peptidase Clan PC(C) family C56 [Leptomonas pyrrhocoris]|eukprot:XP_015664913.1 putative PFPI/DJ-1-like protein putativecysteine peptidase Clan PC(C) family C56 [Leptomonas pyrrhocoris]